MTIQFKNAGTPADGTAPLTITKPSVADNDIIEISISIDSEDTPAAISGFTQVDLVDSGGDNLRLQVFIKEAGGSEPSTYDITGFTGGAKATIRVIEDSIGGGTWTIGSPVNANGSGAVNVGPLTTSNNSMLMGAWANDSDSLVSSSPLGMTLSTNSPTGGTTVAMYTYHEFINVGGSDSRSLTYDADFTCGVLYELTYTGAAGASITDVNTDEIIDDAETGITLTVNGFGSDINEVKLISGTAETTVLSLSGTGDSYTFSNIDVAALSSTTLGAPLTTASNVVQVEATDGTDTEVLTITSNPKSGWAVVEVVSALKTEGHLGENFIGTIPDTSEWYFPIGSGDGQLISVTPAGLFTTNSTTNVDCQYWDATLENWQQFTVIITVSGSADASTSLPGLKLDYFRVGLSITDGTLNDNEAAFYKQELSVSSGALNDLRVAYFKSISGLSVGTLQDLEMAYYHTEGAVTSTVLQDAAKAFYRIKLGV